MLKDTIKIIDLDRRLVIGSGKAMEFRGETREFDVYAFLGLENVNKG